MKCRAETHRSQGTPNTGSLDPVSVDEAGRNLHRAPLEKAHG